MYDVAIIGAGVIGSAIARELSRYQANVCVIEREEDVCDGTSKANSAIIHAGFDAAPGSLKAKLNVRGNEMMDALSKDLDIPFKRNGSLVVCTKDQDCSGLDALLEKGERNGVPGLRILERDELLQLEPNLSDDVTCGLYAPTGGIVCPFHMTMAFAENAYTNGVSFFLNTKVTSIQKKDGGYTLETIHTDTDTPETFEAKVIINAAGVHADEFNNMVSEHKLHITARKGEYCLLDKEAGTHVSHTIFQLPSKMGKGVLVTPTVHGNLLVGPTAVDVTNKEAVNTGRAGFPRKDCRIECQKCSDAPGYHLICRSTRTRRRRRFHHRGSGRRERFYQRGRHRVPWSLLRTGNRRDGRRHRRRSSFSYGKNRFHLHTQRHLKTRDAFHGGAQSADQRASGIRQHHLPLRDDQ